MEHLGDMARSSGSATPPKKHKGFMRLLRNPPKHLVVTYPLFGMLGIAFGLAGMTITRELTLHPNVELNKRQRASDELREIEHSREVEAEGRTFTDTSPLHRLVKMTNAIPSVLPGDESSAIGPPGVANYGGKRGGGI